MPEPLPRRGPGRRDGAGHPRLRARRAGHPHGRRDPPRELLQPLRDGARGAWTSTTRRWSLGRTGRANAVPRVVGPDPAHAPGRGRRPPLPARAHRPAGQDHAARPVHHEPAGAERGLPRRRRARARPRRGRQRGDARPVRRRRRRRPDRRAVAAVAARAGARVRGARRSTARSRASRGRPRCTPASATPTSCTTGPPATRSSPSSTTAPSTRSRSSPPSRGSTSRSCARSGDKTVILGVLDLSRPDAGDAPTRSPGASRPRSRSSPAERLQVAPDCGMKYLPRDVALAKLRALVEGAERVRGRLA